MQINLGGIDEHLFGGFIGPKQMNRAGLKRTSSEMLSRLWKPPSCRCFFVGCDSTRLD